ncbi:MAG TPA: MBL fold metallo-hydrolase [Actinomycetota bacterium]|nr:MBL fold metallo-hydrolase [Actinomycetota bacterium]
MRVLICGVRGSTPAPGAEFVRYGGNTSCVGIAGDGVPRLVLDAGTGLRQLSAMLAGEAFQGTILLSHLHWDHTHGLPFFPAGDREEADVTVLLPAQGEDAEVLLDRVMSPPHFPVRPSELRGRRAFGSLEAGSHTIEGFSVLARQIPHKGGRTFGYRVTDASGASLAYLPDHSPTSIGPGLDGFGEYHEAARELVEGVDLLIHDAQYTAAELPGRLHFGHAAIDYSVGLATACGVKRLLLFHHDPPRTDEQLDAIVAGLREAPLPVSAAAEATVIELDGRGRTEEDLPAGRARVRRPNPPSGYGAGVQRGAGRDRGG